MNIFSLAPTTEGAYSIPMAIVDFLPVLFYFLAAWLIAKDLYNKSSKTAFAFLASGSIMVFIGGAFKALWKLLFCFGINYPFFFACFFPMQAPGFCLYLAGLIMTLRGLKKGRESDMNVIAATVTSSMPLLIFQTLGSIGSLIVMCIFAKKLKQTPAIILFVLSILCLLGMGYLAATLDSSLSWANWVEQGVNTLGQIFFFLGVLILHKNGLGNERI